MYVQQNNVDNVYNLGLILFRDLVSGSIVIIAIRKLKCCGVYCNASHSTQPNLVRNESI